MTITLDRPVHTSTATAISHRDLTPQQQAGWDQLLTDTHDARDAATIKALHAAAAPFLGVQLAENGELVECGCHLAADGCPDDCDAIYNQEDGAEFVEGSTQLTQCASCVADHRHYGD